MAASVSGFDEYSLMQQILLMIQKGFVLHIKCTALQVFKNTLSDKTILSRMGSSTLSFVMHLLYTLNSVGGMGVVAYDQNLSGHGGEVFSFALCRDAKEIVLFYKPLFFYSCCFVSRLL